MRKVIPLTQARTGKPAGFYTTGAEPNSGCVKLAKFIQKIRNVQEAVNINSFKKSKNATEANFWLCDAVAQYHMFLKKFTKKPTMGIRTDAKRTSKKPATPRTFAEWFVSEFKPRKISTLQSDGTFKETDVTTWP